MTGYFGSKAGSGLYQNIIAIMPPHDTYIETHLGGGAVMQKKPPARLNIAIDIDPEALASFDCGYPVQKLNDCAHRYLGDYDYSGTELIYCDPPYLLETRTSKRRYRHEYSRQDHLDLLELLKTLPCRVILSGYPSALYDGMLEGLELCGATSHDLGRSTYRETLVQLRHRPRVLGHLRGEGLHRPPAHQTKGRTLGKELPGATPCGAARPVVGDHGGGSGLTT